MNLETVIELEARIHERRAEIEAMRSSMSASRLDGLPRGRETASRVEMTAIKIEAAERELAAMTAEYQAESARLSHEIMSRVWPRNQKAGDVLFRRFLFGQSITEIAAEMKCVPSHVSRLTTAGRKILERTAPSTDTAQAPKVAS